HLTLPALWAGPLPLLRKRRRGAFPRPRPRNSLYPRERGGEGRVRGAAQRARLFPELGRPPPDGGGDALGGDHFAELLTELGPGRVEWADDVEAGVKRRAEAGGVGAAVDCALSRVERFRRNQREPLGPAQARFAQLRERHDAVDHAERECGLGV